MHVMKDFDSSKFILEERERPSQGSKGYNFDMILEHVQITIAAFISGTTFFRTRLHQDNVSDGGLYLNALFYAVIIMTFTGFGELASTIGRLPVLIKQRDMLLSPAWAYSVSTMLLSIPTSILECGIFVGLTYYVTGYAPEASRFFKQFLTLFLIQQQAGGMFRFIAGLCRTITLAFTLGWILILLIFMLGGFIIPRANIPVWWRWGYWLTNMGYADEAMSNNEMTAPRWEVNHYILFAYRLNFNLIIAVTLNGGLS